MKRTIGTLAVVLGLATAGPALAYMGASGAASGGAGTGATTGNSGTTTAGGNNTAGTHQTGTVNNQPGTMNSQSGTMNNQTGTMNRQGQVVQLDNLSQPVQTAINQHLQGGNVTNIRQVSTGNGRTFYLVRYQTGNGKTQLFRVDSNGQFLGPSKGNWSNQKWQNNNSGR